MGLLTRDPEVRHTSNGTQITEFTIAVQRPWKTDSGEKKQDTDFIDIVFFGGVDQTLYKFPLKTFKLIARLVFSSLNQAPMEFGPF